MTICGFYRIHLHLKAFLPNLNDMSLYLHTGSQGKKDSSTICNGWIHSGSVYILISGSLLEFDMLLSYIMICSVWVYFQYYILGGAPREDFLGCFSFQEANLHPLDSSS